MKALAVCRIILEDEEQGTAAARLTWFQRPDGTDAVGGTLQGTVKARSLKPGGGVFQGYSCEADVVVSEGH